MDRKRLMMFLFIISFLLIIVAIHFFIGIWEEGAKRGFAGMVFIVGVVLGMAGIYMTMKLEIHLKS
ncbi:MAG: hypothetical protein Q7J09_01340 [Methanocalculus sp.]|uniref:hypothetical protein n=1 Tax=Methanocalculus sp. TaxID=2004547 RepID=UPI00271E815C|nr:hypothetical protein [Methanocalculus sp.]MDO9538637.1 hypothetical protein [Methanocalculus sp.]